MRVHRLCLVTLLTFLVICEVRGKKSKKPKRPKEEQDVSTPRPDVATYSPFGYNNDGGPTYDGFVPSSPDYANYLNSFRETTTRLYAPAFPTALDTSGAAAYGNNYESQNDGQNYKAEEQGDSSVLQFQPNSLNYMNSPDLSESSNMHQTSNLQHDFYTNHDDGGSTAPIYGTKISSKYKNGASNNNINHNETNNIYESLSPTIYENKHYQEVDSNNENNPAVLTYETVNKYYDNNNPYNYAPTFPPTSGYQSNPNTNKYSFPKVVDFTKHKVPYATSIDNQYISASLKSSDIYNSKDYKQNDIFSNSYKYKEENEYIKSSNKDSYDLTSNEKEKKNYYNQLDYSNSKYKGKNTEPFNDYKDKVKHTYTTFNNYSPDYNKWKNSFHEYKNNNLKNSTYIKTNNNYQTLQNPYDAAESATNNVIDLTNYRFPSFEKEQKYNHQDFTTQSTFDYPNAYEWKNFENSVMNPSSDSYNKPIKNTAYAQATAPTTTSYWGNNFKTYSSGNTLYNTNSYKKPQYHDEIDHDDVVYIPKKQQSHKHHNLKYHHESKPKDWKHVKLGMGKPIDEWNKEVATRFKSEEDLLGLRTHDTSHPSYLPMFKLNNDADDFQNNYPSNYDYKSAIEKWRQNYLKSKYHKNWESGEQSLSSESRPVHVPILKPYPVEVPHPVIVPVPQPYPVRVPVPKPVAVPVVRELTVPIEKPVPYPVIKKVPYPVEKPVPVPIEKAVPVPVMKPYPVPIPHVRPVFHHSRYTYNDGEEESDVDQDLDDEQSPSNYQKPDARTRGMLRAKKPKSSRNQPRRPQRPSFPEKNRRRWPPRRPLNTHSRSRRPNRLSHQYETKHTDNEPVQSDYDHNYFLDYCRYRNGNC